MSLSQNTTEFPWIDFYQAMADGILSHRNNRKDLAQEAYSIVKRIIGSDYLTDLYEDGTTGPLQDICPFTLMGTFNRRLSNRNRRVIAGKLADFLGVQEKAPNTFFGVPYLANGNSWFFGFTSNPRSKEGDISRLWETFASALEFAETDNKQTRDAFSKAYDTSMKQFHVKWTLTTGLYWIRPCTFPTLDIRSQQYIEKRLRIPIGRRGPKGCCDAQDYLCVLDTLKAGFEEEAYGNIRSFPELSRKAWE